MSDIKELVIYTDGASRGNPGRGGFGAILKWGPVEKEISGGYRLTTNNRMELMAVIAALELLNRENLNITVYSDCQDIAAVVICIVCMTSYPFKADVMPLRKIMVP